MTALGKAMHNAVESMIKNGKLEEPANLTLPSFVQQDILNHEIPNLNSKALQATKTKIHNLIHQRNELASDNPKQAFVNLLAALGVAKEFEETQYIRVCDIVNYVGRMVTKDTYNKGVAEVVACINELADNDAITGFMTPLTAIEMQSPDLPEKKWAIISYMAINHHKQKWVEDNFKHMLLREGEAPKDA